MSLENYQDKFLEMNVNHKGEETYFTYSRAITSEKKDLLKKEFNGKIYHKSLNSTLNRLYGGTQDERLKAIVILTDLDSSNNDFDNEWFDEEEDQAHQVKNRSSAYQDQNYQNASFPNNSDYNYNYSKHFDQKPTSSNRFHYVPDSTNQSQTNSNSSNSNHNSDIQNTYKQNDYNQNDYSQNYYNQNTYNQNDYNQNYYNRNNYNNYNYNNNNRNNYHTNYNNRNYNNNHDNYHYNRGNYNNYDNNRNNYNNYNNRNNYSNSNYFNPNRNNYNDRNQYNSNRNNYYNRFNYHNDSNNNDYRNRNQEIIYSRQINKENTDDIFKRKPTMSILDIDSAHTTQEAHNALPQQQQQQQKYMQFNAQQIQPNITNLNQQNSNQQYQQNQPLQYQIPTNIQFINSQKQRRITPELRHTLMLMTDLVTSLTSDSDILNNCEFNLDSYFNETQLLQNEYPIKYLLNVPTSLAEFLIESLAVNQPDHLKHVENKIFEGKQLIKIACPAPQIISFENQPDNKIQLGFFDTEVATAQETQITCNSILSTLFDRKILEFFVNKVDRMSFNFRYLEELAKKNDFVYLISAPEVDLRSETISFLIKVLEYNWSHDKEQNIIKDILQLIQSSSVVICMKCGLMFCPNDGSICYKTKHSGHRIPFPNGALEMVSNDEITGIPYLVVNYSCCGECCVDDPGCVLTNIPNGNHEIMPESQLTSFELKHTNMTM
ncbi:hypothetical protein TRFO_43124 [Tritrichomonas foetus]|uniref:Uncharacterized protein n=1 Tax=Tritrichomonas foetus TaxID=1144522 RepID=A0A1J4KXK7_9EUKA|nr:hypothetical protein TRFO_43124 [Tritrichomonas foetus]|eukprot:OHT14293.1 hypothetical protein TRFO_43124 [Tritrichomonas foetus]